jgi:hypothetical protein
MHAQIETFSQKVEQTAEFLIYSMAIFILRLRHPLR